jgi:hypothetical protein
MNKQINDTMFFAILCGMIALHFITLSFFDVSILSTVKYFAYVLIVLVFPGFIFVRILLPSRSLIDQLVLGYPIALCIEGYCIIAIKYFGLSPWLLLLLPASAIILFLFKKDQFVPVSVKKIIPNAKVSQLIISILVPSLFLAWFCFILNNRHPSNVDFTIIHHDIAWTLGNCVAQTRNLIPDDFHFLGKKLYYHYGQVLHLISIQSITRISFFSLLCRLDFSFNLLYILISLVWISRKLINSFKLQFLMVFLSIFGNSIIPLLSTSHFWQVLYYPLSYFFSLIFLFPLLVVIKWFTQGFNKNEFLIGIVLLIAIIGAKSNLFPLLFATLFAVSFIARLSGRPLKNDILFLLVPLCFFMAWFFIIYSKTSMHGTLMFFDPPFIMVKILSFLHIVPTSFAGKLLILLSRWIVFLPGWIGGCLLVPVIIVSYTLLKTLRNGPIDNFPLFALLFVIVSFIPSMFMRYLGYEYNLMYPIPIITIAAMYCMDKINKNIGKLMVLGLSGWLVISLIIDINIVNKFSHTIWGISKWKQNNEQKLKDDHTLSRNEYSGLVFIRDHTPFDALIICDRHGFSHVETTTFGECFFYYSAFSERHYFMEGSAFNFPNPTLVKERKSISNEIYGCNPQEGYRNCKQFNISYLIWSKRFCQEPEIGKNASYVKNIFDNEHIRIYKIL